MGIPYSKQINAAFDQVTPLVASGFEVLDTIKNISLILLGIQILTVVLLSLILATLLALLIVANPDLEAERRSIVTPGTQWVARKVIGAGEWWDGNRWKVFVAFGMVGVAAGLLAGSARVVRGEREAAVEEVVGDVDLGEEGEKDDGKGGKGKEEKVKGK